MWLSTWNILWLLQKCSVIPEKQHAVSRSVSLAVEAVLWVCWLGEATMKKSGWATIAGVGVGWNMRSKAFQPKSWQNQLICDQVAPGLIKGSWTDLERCQWELSEGLLQTASSPTMYMFQFFHGSCDCTVFRQTCVHLQSTGSFWVSLHQVQFVDSPHEGKCFQFGQA